MRRFKVVHPLTFLWLGFVLAISFFEAPLKFQAPSISIEEGVEIGRIVFTWMNRIEIAFAAVMLIYLVLNKVEVWEKTFARVVIVIVLLQSVWLLPALDDQAQLLFDGVKERDRTYHAVYIVSEVIKVGSLLILGVIQVRTWGKAC